MKAASNPPSYQIETSTYRLKRNRIHLTPLPDQPHPKQPSVEPSWETVENSAKNSAVTPMQSDIATRPKRIIKPSLKVKENLQY